MNKEYNLGKINKLTNELETLKEEKDVVDGKLARLRKSSKDLEDIIESQRSENVKEGVGYNAVPPPAVDLYQSTSTKGQNKNSTTAENGESTDSILSKPAVKFVKAGDKPAERPTTDKVETAKKPAVRYVEMYRRTSKRKRVQRETTRSQNHAYMSPSHRSYGAPMRPSRRPADAASSLGEDCWELNVRSIPTSSVVFPLLVMCSHCQKKFPLLEERFPLPEEVPTGSAK
nr:hypothetical protein [Tanacetum cinerariifolium]